MARIKLKNSQVKDKVPQPADLDVGGELGVNHHADNPGLFLKDTAGNIRKIAGPNSISTSPATESAAGVVELATIAETAAGTDNSRAVHPAGLKALLAASLTPGSTTPPATPATGTTYVDSSVTPAVITVWNGTAWVPQTGTAVKGNTAPTAPATGQVWLDQSTSPAVNRIWDGTNWVAMTVDTGTQAKLDQQLSALWSRSGTVVSPANAGDQVHTGTGKLTVGGTAAAPNLEVTSLGTLYAKTGRSFLLNNTSDGTVPQHSFYNFASWGLGKRTNTSLDFYYDQGGTGGAGGTAVSGAALSNLGVFTIGANGAAAVSLDPGTTGSPLVRDSSGKVGIGDPAPDSTVTIKAAAATTPLKVSGPSSEFLRCDQQGRLLVGTSSGLGTSLLQLQGNTSSNTGEAKIFLRRGQDVPTIGANIGSVLGQIAFGSSDGGGGAVIGAESDATWSTAGSGDYPGRLVFSTTADGASSPTERMRITQAGHVFVGNVTGDYNTVGISLFSNGNLQAVTNQIPTLVLNRKGSDGVIVDFYRDTNNPGTISVTTTATSYNTSSDYRLKENVTPVTDGITRLQQLKPSRFNFIAAPGCTVDGFIAHEVQSVVPEAITGEKDAVDTDGKPQYQGIDQSKLVPLLTAALQEAVAKIESLESRLTVAGI